MDSEVDGGVGCPSDVDSGLWMPFSRPKGVGRRSSIDGSGDRRRFDGTPCHGCGSPVTARSMMVASAVGGGDEGEGTGAGRGEGNGEREWGGFPRERFPPLGGSRSAQPPNSKPCFISPTNPPDSRPPVERDTCCLSSQTQELPSEPPRRRTRSSLPPAVTPRCWSLLAVLPDTGPGMPPWCCRRGGRGLLGRTTTPPTPTHPHPAY